MVSRWEVRVGVALVLASALTYALHYLIFHDPHHIFIYMVGDLAFVPVEVLLVTLIIHRMMDVREKKLMMEKLNMVIGVFFSEVGTKLLTHLSDADPQLPMIRENLIVKEDWSEQEFDRVDEMLRGHDYSVDASAADLRGVRELLQDNRDLLLRLLENHALLEHEEFTDLLQAVFHFTEELSHRDNIEGIPETDAEHIAGDMERVYGRLVRQWLDYMRHLKNNYPYLFSLAMRTNPFDEDASPVVS